VEWVAILLGFVLGLIGALGFWFSRRFTHHIDERTERVDTDITTLGEQERAITSGLTDSVDAITGITAQIEHHITTVSGMGDDIQQLNDLLERIQERNRTTASGVAGAN